MRPSLKHYSVLLGYLKAEWSKALALAAALLGGIGLQLLAPQILRSFIDTALADGATQALVLQALLFLGVTIVAQALSVLTVYLGQDVSWTATNGLRADLAEHCLALDLEFHNSHSPGELIERIDGDINALSTFFSEFVTRLVGSALLLLGVLALLFREDWRVGLALSAFVALALFVLQRVRNVAVEPITQERQLKGELFGFIEERLAGIDDLRANSGGPHAMASYHRALRRLFHTGRRAAMIQSTTWIATMSLFAFGVLLTLSLGAYLYLNSLISLGTVYLFFQYTDMLRNPLEQITRQFQDLQKASAGMLRVRQLLAVQPQIRDGAGGKLPPGALSVAFEQASFRYEDGQEVLRDISFRLGSGQVLGLLGRTGSGKSTMTRLLFRFYELSGGSIRLGDVDIRTLPLRELRSHIGMVTQEVQLFHATVRDNLSLFDSAIADERIVAVLEELGLGPWYHALPDGLDTLLLGDGGGLSAGQGQLLAFARVFLKDPGLVILDEPSSRLDPATEQLVTRALARLLRPEGRRRTCIIIAHRLATVERADDILILDGGRVVEHGPREALAGDPDSRFARLLQAGLEGIMA